jgi:hypothetical protein
MNDCNTKGCAASGAAAGRVCYILSLILLLVVLHPVPAVAAGGETHTVTLTGTHIEFYAPANCIQNIVFSGKTEKDEAAKTITGAIPAFTVNGTPYSLPLEKPLYEGDKASLGGSEYRTKGSFIFDGVNATRNPNFKESVYVQLLDAESSSTSFVSSHCAVVYAFKLPQHVFVWLDYSNSLYYMNNGLTNATAMKNWLVGELAAGTPLMVVYDLATPTSTTFEPVLVENANGLVTITSDAYMEIVATAYVDQTPPDDGGNDNENSSSIPADSSDTGSTPENSDSSDVDSSVPDDSSSGSTPEPSASTADSDPRPFLTTPFNDYSVTEGLLLALFVFVVLFGIIAVFKGR